MWGPALLRTVVRTSHLVVNMQGDTKQSRLLAKTVLFLCFALTPLKALSYAADSLPRPHHGLLRPTSDLLRGSSGTGTRKWQKENPQPFCFRQPIEIFEPILTRD